MIKGYSNMKKALIFSLLAVFISVTGLSTTAEAKRFGGGMSFGKSFNKQKSFSRSAPKQNLNNQKAAPTQGAKTGSRAGGMMGILGGLAVGGLLGAMFFGGGFEGINFMDILIFGGIAFAIFWFMRRAAGARRPEYAHAGQTPHNQTFGQQQPDRTNNDSFMGSETTVTAAATPDIDAEHFVSVSRDIFMRMQTDWDEKNSDDIRAFCTPEIAERVLEDMAQAGDNKSRTEVAMLNAEIEETWIESDLEWVAIHFKAMLKEETLDAQDTVLESTASEVNEFWIFQHNPNSEDPTWYLAGIQQV
jgi:predicted lipid-binding transport protein (Tim44 family)